MMADLNSTLDDVEIPQSFLDDDIKIEFETSALNSFLSSSNLSSFNDDKYGSQESLNSSIYFSAAQSFCGDCNPDIFLDEELAAADYFEEALVEPEVVVDESIYLDKKVAREDALEIPAEKRYRDDDIAAEDVSKLPEKVLSQMKPRITDCNDDLDSHQSYEEFNKENNGNDYNFALVK